ncbi:tripartite tricarboxylate transporter substrate binding protein [Oscillospiraceae bacterium LTW-04]|nr:tripartite tricarboxylate transporter substrate binding protein [Oscillospiraceae bacterium MB24-C1]
MNKKIMAVLLSAMMVFSFAACASSSQPSASSSAETAPSEAVAPKLDYPKRAIEMVVPFGAGGSADMMARNVAQIMGNYIDKPINVVNKAGGGSTTGMIYANEQEADGYTILEITPSLPIIEAQGIAPINFTENFVPIGNFQVDIQSFAINKNNPNFSDLDTMIAYAKAHPDTVKVGGTSPGGLDDYIVRGFSEAAGIQLLYVPYNSAAETKSALLGGEIDIYQDKLISFIQMLQTDEVVPIVTLYDRRLTEVEEMKDVPCTVEKGINFTQGSWRGFAVKKGTPQEIVDYLEELLKKVYDSEEYRKMAENDKSDLIPGYIDAKTYGELWQKELVGYKDIFSK